MLPVSQFMFFNIFHWEIHHLIISILMTFSALVIVNQAILGIPRERFASFKRLTIERNFCSWLIGFFLRYNHNTTSRKMLYTKLK